MQLLAALDCNTFLPDLYNGLRTKASGCTELREIKSFGDITLIIVNVIHIALALGGTLAVGFIIFGAVQYIMSQGQPDRIKKAKDTIVNSVVGLFLTILAYLIIALIAGSLTGPLS